MTGLNSTSLCAVLTCAFTAPVFSAECEVCGYPCGSKDISQRQSSQTTPSGSQTGASQQKGQSRDALEIEPTGWITVGYDYDADGRFDVIESMYAFDLERARQQSQRRGGQSGDRDQTTRTEERMARSEPSRRISGEITGTRSTRLMGLNRPVVLAHIQTDQGAIVAAVLGEARRVSQLDLRRGDRVAVEGKMGFVNDQPALIADRLSTRGRTLSASLPSTNRLQRFHDATLLATRTGTHRRSGESHLIGRVQLESGRTMTVDFGPARQASEANLTHGDSVSILARPGLINGEPGLKAVQFRSGGKLFDTGLASAAPSRQR